MRSVRTVILVLVGMLMAVDSSAQQSTGTPLVERVTSHLTGGSQRSWVVTRWEPVLTEQVRKCVRGEIWIFSQGGNGIKKICANGMEQEQEFNWSWVEPQDDQPLLMVDGTRYIIVLRRDSAPVEGDPPVLITILRTLRTSQDMVVEEIELIFQDM